MLWCDNPAAVDTDLFIPQPVIKSLPLCLWLYMSSVLSSSAPSNTTSSSLGLSPGSSLQPDSAHSLSPVPSGDPPLHPHSYEAKHSVQILHSSKFFTASAPDVPPTLALYAYVINQAIRWDNTTFISRWFSILSSNNSGSFSSNADIGQWCRAVDEDCRAEHAG